MWIKKIDENQIFLRIPIAGNGNPRIKKRKSFRFYGESVPTRSEKLSADCYAEWLIDYAPIEEVLKAAYELKIIEKDTLLNIKRESEKIKEYEFIDNKLIKRKQHIFRTKIAGISFISFYEMYPLFIRKFRRSSITLEIVRKKQQIGTSVQPWLQLCIPIVEFSTDTPLINRTAASGETADFVINSENIGIFLEMLKIFGILSPAHNHDIKMIIDKIVEE
jgi:hypothetical protein